MPAKKHFFFRKQDNVAWRTDPALEFAENTSGDSLRLVSPNRRPKPFADNGSKPRTRTTVFTIDKPKRLRIDDGPPSVNVLELRFLAQSFSAFHSEVYTVNCFLPLDRRREITRCPPLDFIRFKKPWTLFFLRLLGCRYVMDIDPPWRCPKKSL